MKIHFYKASIGDCFLIDFENEYNTKFIIDTGTKTAFQDNICEDLKKELMTYNNHLFLTHIDNDHIGGMLYLCEYECDVISCFKKVYYNTFDSLKSLTLPTSDDPPKALIQNSQSGFTSYQSGTKLEDFIEHLGVSVESCNLSLKRFQIDDIFITILSPSEETLKKYSTWVEKEDKSFAQTSMNTDYHKSIDELSLKIFVEDNSPTNGSSISMLIEHKDHKLLFLGDAFPSDIVTSLKKMDYSEENKLKADIVKVSHHGSKNNTSNELLELLDCDKYLISTDGKRFNHPDKEALARIICKQNRPHLLFNYDVYNKIFSKEELSKGLFTVEEVTEVNL